MVGVEGDPHALEQPGYAYDILNARNRVQVTGGTPKKSHRNYRGVAVLPASHPLSAQSLARNGRSRYMTTIASVDSLRSDAACQTRAKKMLNELATEGVEASFACLPVPHLEESDPVTLNVDGYSITFPLRQWTLPLVHDAPMTIGVQIRARYPRKRKRRRGRSHRERRRTRPRIDVWGALVWLYNH